MSEATPELIVEILRGIQRNNAEMRDRMTRMEGNIRSIQTSLAGFHSLRSEDEAARAEQDGVINRLTTRVSRIERRLGLTDSPVA